jgi:spore coat polysaccharide biosynthesis protein SpsF
MSRVALVTQARTTSTRLPGKVLELLGDRTVLELHLDRLATAGLPIIVATTVNATDDPIVEIARRAGVACTRGSEHDVLGRFVDCAREHELDALVRVTSDCPLVDGTLVGRGVEAWLDADDPFVYVSNGVQRTYPRGFDFEVFSREALMLADECSSDAEREHVTPYLYSVRDPRIRLHNVVSADDASDLRVTLDTAADLRLIRELVERYGAADLGVDEIVAVLRAHPELVGLNAHVEQKTLLHTDRGDGS